MRKKLILSLIAVCCCGAFLVGCSSDDTSTPTATAKTPIQLLNESTTARFESVWTQLNAKASNTDLSALANRVGTLEGLNAPNLAAYTAKDTELEGRIAGLESLNISATFTDILAEIAFLKLQSGTPTPTGSPTPTPTPTVYCGVQRPSAVNPSASAPSVNASGDILLFEWSSCAGAEYYLFYLTTDSSDFGDPLANISAPTHSWSCPVTLDGTFYWWMVTSVAECGAEESNSWWFKTQ